MGDTGGVDTSDEVIGKLLPDVCAAHSWPEVLVGDKNLDLRAVPTQQGAAILGVPRDGGDLYGFVVDARGLIIGDPRGTLVKSGTFSEMSATAIDGRLAIAVREGGKVSVDLFDEDLLGSYHVGMLEADTLANTTIMHGRMGYVAAVGGAQGIVATRFDKQWNAINTEVVDASVPTAMASARYGNDALVAWSAEGSCHLSRIDGRTHSRRNFECRNASLATNFADKSGQMVFEHDGGIRHSDILIGAHNDIANNNRLAATGSSPRVVFDGTRYWISFINTHGDVTIGYYDQADGSLVSMALAIRPINGSYDLAVIDGSVWVYALDDENSYSANRMCLTR